MEMTVPVLQGHTQVTGRDRREFQPLSQSPFLDPSTPRWGHFLREMLSQLHARGPSSGICLGERGISEEKGVLGRVPGVWAFLPKPHHPQKATGVPSLGESSRPLRGGGGGDKG